MSHPFNMDMNGGGPGPMPQQWRFENPMQTMQLPPTQLNSQSLFSGSQIFAQDMLQNTEAMMTPAQPRFPQQRQPPPVDMGSVSLTELLGGINEDLLSDMKAMAPDVIDALMRQAPSPGITFQPPPPEADSEKSNEKNREVGRKRGMNSSSEATDVGSTGDEQGSRKVHRAAKNRQAAARSREKKRAHVDELKRRVAMLSAENAQLQVEQLQIFQERIEKERRLKLENKQLEMKVDESKGRLEDTKMKLRQQGIPVDNNKRSTWSSGEWRNT